MRKIYPLLLATLLGLSLTACFGDKRDDPRPHGGCGGQKPAPSGNTP